MYIQRDINNKIVGVFNKKQDFTTEIMSVNSSEVQAFLNPPKTWRERRDEAYKEKGWLTPYDVLDTILDELDAQGISLQVKIDRVAIKAANPKI